MPTAVSAEPHPGMGKPSGMKRTRPMTPAFTTMPDNAAEPGAGATEWASGIQTCSGKQPHLQRESEQQQRQDRSAPGRGRKSRRQLRG